jgi:hypothetical protein
MTSGDTNAFLLSTATGSTPGASDEIAELCTEHAVLHLMLLVGTLVRGRTAIRDWHVGYHKYVAARVG